MGFHYRLFDDELHYPLGTMGVAIGLVGGQRAGLALDIQDNLDPSYAITNEAGDIIFQIATVAGPYIATFNFGAEVDAVYRFGIHNNTAGAVSFEDATGINFFRINTNPDGLVFGNATTNPTYQWVGSGTFNIGGSVGTAGQVLTSNGAGVAPTWQAGAGSGFFVLAGQAGGQIAIGGTAAGDDLTFESTSNATKGTIFFRDSGFVFNNNATAALLELPNFNIMGGDGVAAPNNDIVTAILTLDPVDEIYYFNMLRNRNGAGDAAIRPWFGVGATSTADRDPRFTLQGGTGTNRSRGHIQQDSSTGVFEFENEQDNAGGGTYTPAAACILDVGRNNNATTSRLSGLRLYAGDGATLRNHAIGVSTAGLGSWTVPALNTALVITDGTNIYLQVDAASVQTLRLGSTNVRIWPSIIDNQQFAFNIFQGSNNYYNVDTRNGAEIISHGNTTTNPAHEFLGTGLIRGSSVTGSNVAGVNMGIRAGIGTGTGLPGRVIFSIGIENAGTTTAHVVAEVMRLDPRAFGLDVRGVAIGAPTTCDAIFHVHVGASGLNGNMMLLDGDENISIGFLTTAVADAWSLGISRGNGPYSGADFCISDTLSIDTNTDRRFWWTANGSATQLPLYSTLDINNNGENDRNDRDRVEYVQTSDATPTIIHRVTVPNNVTAWIECDVQGQISSGAAGNTVGYKILILAKATGGAVTVVGTDLTAIEDAGFITATVTAPTTGADVTITVTGIAATTINWKSVTKVSFHLCTTTH